MSKKKKQKQIDMHLQFDAMTVTREELLDGMRYWKSCGGSSAMVDTFEV